MQKEQSTSKDEISVVDLFGFMGKKFNQAISNTIKLLVYLRRILIDFWWLVLCGLILGVSASLYYHFKAKDYFYTEATAVSKYLRGYYFKDLVSELNALCTEFNYDELSKKLDIDLENASGIKSIGAETIYEKHNLFSLQDKKIDGYDSLLLLQIEASDFILSMNVKNTANLKVIEDGLFKYISENSLTNKNYKIFRDNYALEKTLLEQELREIDSFKVALRRGEIKLNDELSSGGNSGDGNSMNIFEQSKLILERLIEVRNELAWTEKLSWASHFTKYKKRGRRRMLYYLFYGCLGGVFLSYMFILLWKFNLYLAEQESTD